MKNYFFYLFTIFLLSFSQLFAYDGIVIVLEAPLLKGPALGSTVLQTIRKGKRVYIPREIGDMKELPEFIPTFDRTGNPAYIPSRYIKVITGTESENTQPIAYKGQDPTDYRIEEPIPVTYPFEDTSFLRASLAFSMANNTTSPYAYNNTFDDQKYRAELGMRMSITRKALFDRYDRFYFGFIGSISTTKNDITFKNIGLAEESRGVIRGGPWLTYDAFKNEKYRLSIGSGFTVNYHRTIVEVSLGAESEVESEERIFSGFSFSPMTSTTFQITEVLPHTDFITGVDLSLFLPHSLTTSDTPEIPGLWPEDSQISAGLKAQASIFMGMQVKY